MSTAEDKPTLTEEMVRTLLKMNPQLRGDGKSTKDVLVTVQQGTRSDAPTKPTLKRPEPVKEIDLGAELRRLHQTYDEAQKRFQAEQAELLQAARKLEDERKRSALQCCERVVEVIVAQDRNLTRSEHQALLAQDKAFLDQIGFSIAKVVASSAKKR